MSKIERIAALINSYAHDYKNRYEAIQLYNEYCDAVSAYGDRAYEMDYFEDVTEGISKYELVRSVVYGDFNPNHDFFRFDVYGNLESTDFPADWIEADEIARYCVANNESFENDEIASILEDAEEVNA